MQTHRLRKIVKLLLDFYNPILPIISNMVNFSLLFIISLYILIAFREPDQALDYTTTFTASLTYALSLGFLLKTLLKAHETIKSLTIQANNNLSLKKKLALIFIYLLIFTPFASASIFILIITSLMLVATIQAPQSSIPDILKDVTTELPILSATVTIMLYMAPMIGLGILNISARKEDIKANANKRQRQI